MGSKVAKKMPYRVTPYHLEIRSLHSDRLLLKEPVSVLVEEEEDQVITYAPDLEIFGQGNDLGEALGDLRQSIIELYEDLAANQGRLGKDLEQVWSYLMRTVEVASVAG